MTLIEVRIMNIHDNSWAAPGIRKIATLKAPYPPSFIRTPACSIETAVGAEACPSGDHVWNGNKAPRTPKPRKVRGKNSLCADIGIVTLEISRMLNVS